MHIRFANILAITSSLMLLAACCDCTSQPTKQGKRGYSKRTSATVKPEVATPKSHKTCTEDFNFKPNTPQYDKCVSSLSEIETKD
jgi:hypothetical protein